MADPADASSSLRALMVEMRDFADAIQRVSMSPDHSAREAALIVYPVSRLRGWADALEGHPAPLAAEARVQQLQEQVNALTLGDSIALGETLRELATLHAALQALAAEMRKNVGRGQHAHGLTVIGWAETCEALVP